MRVLTLTALACWLTASGALAADGQQLFERQCKVCHAGSAMGPSLKGVAGAKIASRAGYSYSPGLKARAGKWTPANLHAYLAAPSKFAPGTRMMLGVASAQDRAALIEYLKTLK